MATEEKKYLTQEEALLEAKALLGVKAEKALRDHLAEIGEDFYHWMADLYVPRKCNCNNFDSEGNRICLMPRDENGKCKCTGGGFYYSNSARDNEGYDIDIESTVQAIRFLQSTGMLHKYSNNLRLALPSQMQKDVISYAKSLQDSEDGYFYHEQWGKKISPSRLGRDLGWATSIIKELGDAPFWDTKNGHKGTLGAPSGVKTAEEGEVKDTSTWIAHFRTLEAFNEYIEAFDLKTRSYSCGNNLNAQTGQMKGRERYGIETGELVDSDGDGIADNGFIAHLRDRFNRDQLPENGLWQEDVCYHAVNGLMKITTSYCALGLKINYPEAAFDSAMKMVLLDADEPDSQNAYCSGSVSIYNPWSAMSAIISNLRSFGEDELIAKLRAKLYDNAEALIRATTKKVKKFKKEDGSFGYTWTYSPATSQGAPAAVPNTVEGDINGGTIAITGAWGPMCSAFGISIPIYNEKDYESFITRLAKNAGYSLK